MEKKLDENILGIIFVLSGVAHWIDIPVASPVLP